MNPIGPSGGFPPSNTLNVTKFPFWDLYYKTSPILPLILRAVLQDTIITVGSLAQQAHFYVADLGSSPVLSGPDALNLVLGVGAS